jgi:AcrR family transcriptional regulator
VEQNERAVKARRYHSSLRQQQAQRTRQRILDVARRRFLTDGYAATTVTTIATDAGVSVDTIYKTFASKPGLVRAIHDHDLTGQGPTPAETRSDALQTTEPDPKAIMRGIGQLAGEVAPRVAPVVLLIRDAALIDPEMAKLKTELDDQRLRRMTHNARNLADAGHLRADVTVDHAGQIMWTYSSPELYELVVTTRGWNVDQYATFIADALIGHLLNP